MFKAEHFDPRPGPSCSKRLARSTWCRRRAHDGFAMYDSGLSDWTVAKMGPHRDTTGELAKACGRKVCILAVVASGEHNFFLGVGRAIPSDINDPQYAAFYGPGTRG